MGQLGIVFQVNSMPQGACKGAAGRSSISGAAPLQGPGYIWSNMFSTFG